MKLAVCSAAEWFIFHLALLRIYCCDCIYMHGFLFAQNVFKNVCLQILWIMHLLILPNAPPEPGSETSVCRQQTHSSQASLLVHQPGSVGTLFFFFVFVYFQNWGWNENNVGGKWIKGKIKWLVLFCQRQHCDILLSWQGTSLFVLKGMHRCQPYISIHTYVCLSSGRFSWACLNSESILPLCSEWRMLCLPTVHTHSSAD